MRVYIGYDPRDELAFRACVASLVYHSSIPLDIMPLKDCELRRKGIYWRPYFVESNGQKIDARDGKPFSTEFSFTRFVIPLIDKSTEPVLFFDADVLFLDDIAKILPHIGDKALYCVQHDYAPKETSKFDGMRQEHYFRKNWSSVMAINPSKCSMTKYILNNQSGSYLHALLWQDESTIGALPPEWNWLEGWSSPDIKPSVVHFTRGTPDLIGNDIPYSAEWWKCVKMWHPFMNRNGLCLE